ncbi:MAG: SDH family Clp fold serine proteinase, partial [Trueperaceae bacterium]
EEGLIYDRVYCKKVRAMQQVLECVQKLEEQRGSRVLLYFLGNMYQNTKMLGPEDVPWLYQVLRTEKLHTNLDVVLHCQGGSVSAAHKIGTLFRGYCDHLTILIPYKAHSAATLLCLGADQLVMTPLSELSPIDPHLGAHSAGEGQPAIMSNEDIRAFALMAKEWFGLEDGTLPFKLLSERVFPPTLGTFYRSRLHMISLAHELLSAHCNQKEKRETIIQQLIAGYHAHDLAIGRAEAKRVGLPVQHANLAEEEVLLELWEACLTLCNHHTNGLILCNGHAFLHTTVSIEEKRTEGEMTTSTVYFKSKWSKVTKAAD